MVPSTPEPPADAAEAYLLLEQLRWNGLPASCPHCRVEGRCYLLRPADGVRRTRTGAGTGRRLWKCGACRRQFSVLTGTVLQGTRVPLPAWIAAIDLYTRAADRVTVSALSDATGLSRAAARHVIERWSAARAASA